MRLNLLFQYLLLFRVDIISALLYSMVSLNLMLALLINFVYVIQVYSPLIVVTSGGVLVVNLVCILTR